MYTTSSKQSVQMLGLDTGYFVALIEGRREPTQVWERLIEGGDEATCSALSMYELERLALRGVIDRDAVHLLRHSIPAIVRVRWVDEVDLLSEAAGLTQGLGLAAMDSLILACLLAEDATTIYTTDTDFERLQRRDVRVINLNARGGGSDQGS